MNFLITEFTLFLLLCNCFNVYSNNLKDLVELNSCCDLALWRLDRNETFGSCTNFKNATTTTANKREEVSVLEVPFHLMTNQLPTMFTLRNYGLHCEYSTKTYTTSYIQLPVSPIYKFQPDGWMQVGNEIHSQYYNQKQYCINGLTNSNLEVVICRRACTTKTPCIRKCCPLNKFYKIETNMCESYSTQSKQWNPTMFKNPEDENTKIDLKSSSQIEPWILLRSQEGWRKHCTNGSLHINYESRETHKSRGTMYRIDESGKITFWDVRMREWFKFESDNYCVDGVNIGNTSNSLIQLVFTCPYEQPMERSASLYYGILCLITSLFSLVTLLVYIILWEKQSIHGWTIMSHTASISLFFIFLGTAFVIGQNEKTQNIWCEIIASLAHFFFISTFSWLTMISFDLWITFRTLTARKSKHIKRFMLYCLFAWGIPLLIVIVAWTLEINYKDNEISTVKVPRYGVQICYISPYSILEYAYYPCGILLCINLTFFAMTTWKLYEHKKSTRFATQSKQKDKQSFILFVKLFFVVGVLWIIEFVNRFLFGTNVPWYVQMLDTLNCLQPVAIFVIFVCKADVIKSLIDKQPFLKPLLAPVLKIQGCRKSITGNDSVTLNSMSKMTDTTMSKLSVSNKEDSV